MNNTYFKKLIVICNKNGFPFKFNPINFEWEYFKKKDNPLLVQYWTHIKLSDFKKFQKAFFFLEPKHQEGLFNPIATTLQVAIETKCIQ